MTTTVATLKAVFTSDTTKFVQGMKLADNRISQMGQRMMGMGKTLTKYVSLPMIAVGGIAAKAAIDWETAFAGVRKTVDGTDEQLAALEQTLLSMATSAESPVSALANAHTQLAGIAEAAGQLGVDIASIPKFTETMAMLGMATNLTGQDAAFMSAQFANITKMDFSDIDRFGATIVALGNNSATTESAILEMSQRLAGIGTTAGLNEAEILGMAAAMSSMGINAEAGGSAMTQVLSTMLTAVATGNGDLQEFADAAGISAEMFANAWREDPAEALTAFIDGLAGMDAGQLEATLETLGLDGLRVADMLRRMAGNNELLTDTLGLGIRAWQDNNALTEEAEKRADTTAGKLALLRNKANGLAITLGNELLPPLTDVVGWLADMADKAANANPKLFRIAGMAVIAGIAIGPLTIIFGGLWTILGLATSALFAFNGALLLALVPIALAVGLFYAYETNLYGFRDAIDGITNKQLIGFGIGILAITVIITNFGVVTGIATSAVWGLSGALAFLVTPLGFLAVVGFAVAAAWATNFGGMRTHVDELRDSLKEGDIPRSIQKIGEALLAIPSGIARKIVGPEDWERGIEGWKTTGAAFRGFGDWMGREIEKGFNGWKEGGNSIDAIGAWIADTIAGAAAGDPEDQQVVGSAIANNILQGIGMVYGTNGETLKRDVIAPIIGVLGGPDTLLDIFNKGSEVGGKIVNGILDAMGGLAAPLIRIINDAIPNSINLGELGTNTPFGRISAGNVSINLPDNPIPTPRKLGGTVNPNTIYKVGERGAETFQPGRTGRIISNEVLGGGNGPMHLTILMDSAPLYDGFVAESDRRGEIVVQVR